MAISQPIVIGIDAGGTMTDTILVDETGPLQDRQGGDHAA